MSTKKSKDESLPICKIDDKVIYIDNAYKKTDINDIEDIENIFDEYLNEFDISLSVSAAKKVLKCINSKDCTFLSAKESKILNHFTDYVTSNKKIIESKKPINIIPNATKREVLYVVGKSGSGKSYFIAKYCHAYNILFPENDIYFISAKDLVEDGEVFDNVKNMKQLDLTDLELMKDLTQINASVHFKNSLVVFDDVEGFDKNITKYVDLLLENLLELGRSTHTYIILARHTFYDAKKTKKILNELDKLVIFNKTINRFAFDYLCKNYLSFDKKQIYKILNSNGRWTLISLTVPEYYISEFEFSFL